MSTVDDTSVAFAVPSGLRLRAWVHGPRVGIGPRLERLAPDPAAATSAEDRLAATWSSLAGGGYEPAPRDSRLRRDRRHRRRRGGDWTSIQAYLDGLVAQHQALVVRSARPVPPTPRAPERHRIRRELCAAEVGGQPWWNLPVWGRAWRRAGARRDAEVARREAEPRAAAAAGQDAADRWWDRLVANDPRVVTGHLDRAFAEHATPAAAVDVGGARVRVIVSALPVDKLVGTREPRAAGEGRRHGRLNEQRRHSLYEAVLHSTLLCVAAEVFALAPSIDRVALAVVAPGFLGGPAVLVLAELPRDLVLPDGAARARSVDLVDAAASGRGRLVHDKGGRLGALRPIEGIDRAGHELLDAIEVV